MTFQPYHIYTPTRNTDGAGGWVETLGTARTFWGSTQFSDTNITITGDARENVLADDIVVIGGEQYRIRRGLLTSNAQLKQYQLVKIERAVGV
jgi:hypothetical protein